MITSLNGILIVKNPTDIVVECAGVGYALTIPFTTYQSLPEIGEKVFIYTYLRILDDRHQLFGFTDLTTKKMFGEIIKINKVGPAIAIAILSRFSIADFLQLIAQQDVKLLTTVPGIGGKTAERIALELKGSLQKGNFVVNLPEVSHLPSGQRSSSLIQQAIAGLENLGLSRNEASKIIKKVATPNMTLQEIMAAAFKENNNK